MAKVAYVPYDETMATIFQELGLTVATSDFGGEEGWALQTYQNALSDAWDALFLLDDFEFDGDPDDDWDEAEALIHGEFTVKYWSSEQGHDPY